MTDVVLHTRALLAGARIRCYPHLPADCCYRIDDSRLTFSADELARRRVAAAIQYQQTFQPLVPPSYRRALGGTLLSNMYWVLHQRRLGRVAPDLADQLCRDLIAACPLRDQRAVLNGYRFAATHSPRHIPGLAWTARKLIGVQ
jgi:hypothetical protein